MKHFTTLATTGALAAAALTVPHAVSALQFEYMGKYNGSAPINYTRDDSLTGEEVTRNSNPGVFSLRELGNGVSVDDDYTPGVDDFLAWCFDVDKLIRQDKDLTYTPNPNMLDSVPGTTYLSSAKDRVQKLFDKSYSLDPDHGVLSSAARSAGFQIAIWEVLYDEADSTTNKYDLDDGAFSLNSRTRLDDDGEAAEAAAKAAAIGFLEETATFTGPKAWDIALYESEDHQNLGVATAVPLPAAAWLLMFASGGLIAAKRRQARKSA